MLTLIHSRGLTFIEGRLYPITCDLKFGVLYLLLYDFVGENST